MSYLRIYGESFVIFTGIECNSKMYENQIIEKKIPGAGSIYLVYDVLGRIILTQDAAMRYNDPKNWLFNKYDAFNRPILTGVYTCGTSLSQQQLQGLQTHSLTRPNHNVSS